MFYFLVGRFPLITGSDNNGKMFRIFLIGSICYIILHALLNSSVGSNIEILIRYRHYLYYAWLVDFALLFLSYKIFGSNEEDEQLVSDLPSQQSSVKRKFKEDVQSEKVSAQKREYRDDKPKEDVRSEKKNKLDVVSEKKQKDEKSSKKNERDTEQDDEMQSLSPFKKNEDKNVEQKKETVKESKSVCSDTDIPKYNSQDA